MKKNRWISNPSQIILWRAGYINRINREERQEREELKNVFLADLVLLAVQRKMILMNSPRLLLSLGLILLLLGVILPFLMVIHVLESTFFMNFFSWGASVTGLAFGTIGFALYSKTRKRD